MRGRLECRAPGYGRGVLILSKPLCYPKGSPSKISMFSRQTIKSWRAKANVQVAKTVSHHGRPNNQHQSGCTPNELFLLCPEWTATQKATVVRTRSCRCLKAQKELFWIFEVTPVEIRNLDIFGQLFVFSWVFWISLSQPGCIRSRFLLGNHC